jgi:hypothetical protein
MTISILVKTNGPKSESKLLLELSPKQTKIPKIEKKTINPINVKRTVIIIQALRYDSDESPRQVTDIIEPSRLPPNCKGVKISMKVPFLTDTCFFHKMEVISAPKNEPMKERGMVVQDTRYASFEKEVAIIGGRVRKVLPI